MIILVDGVRYRKIQPENEAELEKSISENHTQIFGSNSFYFDTKRKLKSPAGVGSIPDGYVIFFDPKPKWAIIEVELSNHPLYNHIIPQITKFNRGMQDSSSRRKIIDSLYRTITDDEVLQAQFKKQIGTGEIHKFIFDLIAEDPMIIIAIDESTEELDEAIRDIRGDVKVIEYNIFQRDGFNEPLRAFAFKTPFNFESNIVDPIPNKNCKLPSGLKLYGNYKGQKFKAEVIENCQIKFNGKVYSSPSKAALAAINSTGASRSTVNGWKWWKLVDKSGFKKTINILKK